MCPRRGRWLSPDPFFHVLHGNINDSPLNILQAGNLYMYCVHNPVRWIDPTGLVIQLVGSQEDRELILSHLQLLTNHTLTFNSDGVVSISSFATGDAITLASGNALIERMIASAHVAFIAITTGDNRNLAFGNNAFVEGVGAGSMVLFNPFRTPYTYTVNSWGGGGKPIAYRTAMPLHIMLGHELIHADRAMRGVMIPLEQTANITITRYRATLSPLRPFSNYTTVTHRNVPLEEWATIGLGHYTANCITENMLRREHGLPRRVSHRGHYR